MLTLERQALQAKGAAAGARLPPSTIRRNARRQAFKGAKRAVVVLAAAEPEADAAPVRRSGPRRQQREVTVKMEQLTQGSEFQGVVKSVESFGAFVDIGAPMDGLVHVSQLTDGFVKNTADVVSVGDTVTVRVLNVDTAQNRLALTMKGQGRRRQAASVDDDDDVEEDEEEVVVADNEAMYEGTFFRIEDVNEPISELDEFEYDVAAEGEEVGTALALAEEDLVTGRVASVEDFGLIVEFQAGGKTVQGLLHVSDMRVPATAALAEIGDELLAEEESAPGPAEEGEFLLDTYVDMGGVDEPAKYYKVNDPISCYVKDVEGSSVSLTQCVDVEELMADEEDEEEDLLEVLDAQEGDEQGDSFGAAAEGDADGEMFSGRRYTRSELSATVYDQQSRTYPDRATGGLIQGARDGSMVVAASFPDRPLNKAAINKVPQSMMLEDDDGEESELVDFWTNDLTLPKNFLKAAGYKMVTNEDGSMEVVAREGKSEDGPTYELWDLLNGTDPAMVEDIVRELLDEDDVEEAEVPFLARRMPVVKAASVSAAIGAADVKKLRQATGAGMMDCKKALAENAGDFDKAVEWLRQKGITGADKKAGRVAAEGAVYTYIHPGSRLGVIVEVNCETDFVAASEQFRSLVSEVGMVAASSDCVCVSVDDVPADLLAKERELEMGKEDLKSKPEAVRSKIVDGRLEKLKKGWALLEQPALRDNDKTVAEIVKETIAATGENIQVRRFVKFNLGEGLEKRSTDFAAEVAQQTAAKEKKPEAPKEKKEEPKKEETAKPTVAVSPKAVKELRDKSGAGMMDCKKALAECNNDMEAASEWLRKKGLASADKKAGRLTAEGAVNGYIHPGSRLGVLLEMNCETDFVAKSEQFQGLLQGVAMQIAASPSVEYVTVDEIPGDAMASELAIEMGREDLQSKPEAIRQKIAEGRVKKMMQEKVLSEQPYIMDESKTVSEAVKEAVAKIGENIQIRRFVRYTLGEGIQKKESNLAAEVAAATGGKA